jgi:hypothetical protein
VPALEGFGPESDIELELPCVSPVLVVWAPTELDDPRSAVESTKEEGIEDFDIAGLDIVELI